jgi:hypothetical protein
MNLRAPELADRFAIAAETNGAYGFRARVIEVPTVKAPGKTAAGQAHARLCGRTLSRCKRPESLCPSQS